jgi:PIN domain nuclease of toxin-antitoxin system
MSLDPERLSPGSRALLGDGETDVLLSSASVWEIAIKHALGKLRLPEPPDRYVPSRVIQTRTTPLAIDHAHAVRVGSLPRHHRDPFDRILIAQAQVERVRIMTADPVFEAYDVELLRG